MRLVEIKTRCSDPDSVRRILIENNADYIGTGTQLDTYFNVEHGRLKLRRGNVENHLIRYHRADQLEPKQSVVMLYKPGDSEKLKAILTDALGIKVVVNKVREIYFIGNVKFHLDRVEELGGFAEIEVIDENDEISIDELHRKCEYYIDLLNLNRDEFLKNSYSDMILELK